MSAISANEKSISELLRARGYGHRRTNETGDQRHAIYLISTGEIVGYCHAHEAVKRFLPEECQP